ncbi:MAG: hypothetical protein K5644_05495 [Lachnospiraceae bacterium]|nr:hypothetical protein [Lachnospiraceae bacterium]
MKSITKKSVAGLLAVALLLGTIFAMTPASESKAEEMVGIVVGYPCLEEHNTINMYVTTTKIPKSVDSLEKLISYLQNTGKMKELSAYQEVDSTITGFTGEYVTTDRTLHSRITLTRQEGISELSFEFPVYESGMRSVRTTRLGASKDITFEESVALLQEKGYLQDISTFQEFYTKEICFVGKQIQNSLIQGWSVKIGYKGDVSKDVPITYPVASNNYKKIEYLGSNIFLPTSCDTITEIVEYLQGCGYMQQLSDYQSIDSTVTSFSGINAAGLCEVKLVHNGEDPTPVEGNIISVDVQAGTAVVFDGVTRQSRTVKYEQICNGKTYRMYDASRGEHFYTKNADEKNALIAAGWSHESESDFNVVGAEETDAIPVYRLYNPNDGGMHFYTQDASEAAHLDSIGWDYEGISHYVYSKDSSSGVPQYRLSNPNSTNGEHNWTTNVDEYNMLKAAGWTDEGICWRIDG